MDVQQFLTEFGHIANAPGGVARLKALVLELAIRGELFPPATGVSNSDKLLSEIRSFREKLIANGKLRRTAPLPTIADSELSFCLPEKWSFERLGNVCEIVRGVTFPASNKQTARSAGSVACLRTSNIQAEVNWNDLIFINKELVGREDQWVEVGDTMISMANSYELVGKVALVRQVEEPATFGGFIAAVRPHKLEPAYLYLVLRSPYMQARMRRTANQTTNIANISIGGMRPIPTPIPPIEDQSLIVAKVDELMALCDKLEAQQQERRKLQNGFRQSTLQAVANAQSPHELRLAWTRLEPNFESLFGAPEDVRQFRDVVFDLGLRGILLSEMSARENQVNKDRPPLPLGWQWKTLGELSAYITSGSRGWKKYIASTGDAFIRSQDLKHDTLIFESPAYVALPEKAEGKRTLVEQADLILTITGGNVGKCATVPDLPYKAYVSQHVALIRLHDPDLCEFIHFWMINPYGGRGFLSRYIYGDKPGLNLAQVGSVPIPVPLEKDRDQILNSLRGYQQTCQLLAKQMKAKQDLSAVLAKATVAGFTGITIEQEEDETVKAPETELIAPLHLGRSPDVKSQAPLATLLFRHNGEMSATDLWQRFGGEIDVFYAQLKTEVAHGWIQEPEIAEVREKAIDTTAV